MAGLCGGEEPVKLSSAFGLPTTWKLCLRHHRHSFDAGCRSYRPIHALLAAAQDRLRRTSEVRRKIAEMTTSHKEPEGCKATGWINVLVPSLRCHGGTRKGRTG
jgi:hypothetical protein